MEAATFDLRITIDGSEITDFGEINLTRSVGGLGVSGLSTTQITFECYEADLPSVSRAAQVKVIGCGYLPTFYISNRVLTNGVYKFTCLDRMAFVDVPIDWEAITFAGGKAYTSTILSKMATDCGFAGASATIPSWMEYTLQSKVKGKGFRAWLQELSEAMVGCWVVNSDNKLQFNPFGTEYGMYSATDYSPIQRFLDYSIEGMILSSDGEKWEIGITTHAYSTLQVSSDYYSDSLESGGLAELWSRVGSASYTPFRCDNVYADEIPFANCEYTLGSTKLYVNSISARINKTGCYLALGCNQPSYSEIAMGTKLSSDLDDKVAKNQRMKSSIVSATDGFGLISLSEAVVNSG